EGDVGPASLAVKDAPALERRDPRLVVVVVAVAGRVAGPRHLDPAAGADGERVLLNETRELVGHARVRRDPGAPAQRARRRELPRHGVADEFALVRHRVEQRRQLGLDLEGDDLLVRARLSGHGTGLRKTWFYRLRAARSSRVVRASKGRRSSYDGRALSGGGGSDASRGAASAASCAAWPWVRAGSPPAPPSAPGPRAAPATKRPTRRAPARPARRRARPRPRGTGPRAAGTADRGARTPSPTPPRWPPRPPRSRPTPPRSPRWP